MTRKTLLPYTVTVTPQWDVYGQVQVDVYAPTKALAISAARKKVNREHSYDRTDGRLKYTAELSEG